MIAREQREEEEKISKARIEPLIMLNVTQHCDQVDLLIGSIAEITRA